MLSIGVITHFSLKHLATLLFATTVAFFRDFRDLCRSAKSSSSFFDQSAVDIVFIS